MTITAPDISADAVLPSVESVLRAQGIPDGIDPSAAAVGLAESAVATCRRLAAPRGILADITVDDFGDVFEGEGKNHPQAPLADIFVRSASLTLFAVTLGEDLSREISSLFDQHHYAEAAMLDSAASEAAELAAARIEQHVRESIRPRPTMTTMPFSPGYCGWHITAQRKLFAALHPENIGIVLTDTCLMQPLKSITGVIVVGNKEIFVFEDIFEFCDRCSTRSCRDRIQSMLEES